MQIDRRPLQFDLAGKAHEIIEEIAPIVPPLSAPY